MYSLQGIAHVRALRESLSRAATCNLTYAGIFANDNALLLYEVLQDMYESLGRIPL